MQFCAFRFLANCSIAFLWEQGTSKRRRQAQSGELSVAVDWEAHFVPVSVADESSASGPIADDAGVGTVVEVMLHNGRVLRLAEGVARAAVAASRGKPT